MSTFCNGVSSKIQYEMLTTRGQGLQGSSFMNITGNTHMLCRMKELSCVYHSS